jgi:23S rRNA pseudouridine1911/1915/1917 synthase
MGKLNMINILYEDNHIIVVEKPVGVLSQADITQDMDMLTLIKDYIKETYNKPGNVFLGLVHRLDRMVGGVMVFAKTSKAASRLSDQIRTHNFDKNYLAIVHGKTKNKDTLIDYLLKDEKANMVSVINENTKNGKYAELSYELVDFKDELSCVRIELKTGRPHQIRVQFASRGYPLYGDKRYGKEHDKKDIALFAYQLSFDHPTTKERLTFELMPKQFPFNKFFKII